MRIGRVPVSMLVDTGAKISCVSARLHAALETTNNTAYPTASPSFSLVGANNSPLACSTVSTLPLALPHANIKWPFHVVSNLQPDLIAGVDILAALNATVDLAARKIVFHRRQEIRTLGYRPWSSILTTIDFEAQSPTSVS